jgi:hypothetical protein
METMSTSVKEPWKVTGAMGTTREHSVLEAEEHRHLKYEEPIQHNGRSILIPDVFS